MGYAPHVRARARVAQLKKVNRDAPVLVEQVIDKHLDGKEWLAADQYTLAVRNLSELMCRGCLQMLTHISAMPLYQQSRA